MPPLLKTPNMHPSCALCEHSSHATPYYPSLPKLRHLLNSPPQPIAPPLRKFHIPGQPKMHAKHECAICAEYGHYTHNCHELPKYQNTLFIVRQPHLTPSILLSFYDVEDNTPNETIFYISIVQGWISGWSTEPPETSTCPRTTIGSLSLRSPAHTCPVTLEPMCHTGTRVFS